MGKNYRFIYFLSFICGLLLVSYSSNTIQAQNNCTDRYKLEVFNDFTLTSNVVYGSNVTIGGNLIDLMMDIYEPTNDSISRRPLIILAHSGAFVTGDKTDQNITYYCERFARKGYVVASMSYRINDILAVPNADRFISLGIRAMGDMKAAIRYFRQDADQNNVYKIDTGIVFVGGYSAGAITALHTAYLTDTSLATTQIVDTIQANGGLEGNSGNPGYPTNVHGVINFAGALFDAGIITSNHPPLVSVHGDLDDVVPYGTGFATLPVLGNPIILMDGSQIIHSELNNLGITNSLTTITGGDHGAYHSGSNRDSTLTVVTNFLYDIVCETHMGIGGVQATFNAASFFPHPLQESARLDFPELRNGDLTLYDLQGRPIQQFFGVAHGFQLDRGQLETGVYFYEVRENLEVKATGKLMVH